MKILLVALALIAAAANATKSCERIKVPNCQDIGYNHTSMPNFARQGSQEEAELALKAMAPLFEVGCSPHMRLFACAVYVPMCAKGVERVGPCRGLCEGARSACAPFVHAFGFKWPQDLDCSKFHREEDHEHMCIMGPI